MADITQRRTFSGLQRPLDRNQLRECFSRIQKGQENISQSMSELVASVFEEYKKNMFLNDRNLKLRSSYLLLSKIAQKNGRFINVIKNKLSQGSTDDIRKKVLQLVTEASQDANDKYDSTRKAIKLAKDIADSVSKLIDEYIKENGAKENEDDQIGPVDPNLAYSKIRSSGMFLLDRGGIDQVQGFMLNGLSTIIAKVSDRISQRSIRLTQTLDTARASLRRFRNQLGKANNPLDGTNRRWNLSNTMLALDTVKTTAEQIRDKVDGMGTSSLSTPHDVILKRIVVMVSRIVKANFITNDYNFRNIKRFKGVSADLDEMRKWREKPWKMLKNFIWGRIVWAFNFFIVSPLKWIPYCGRILDEIKEVSQSIKNAGNVAAGGALLFGSGIGQLVFMAQMPKILFGLTKNIGEIISNSFPVRFVKGATRTIGRFFSSTARAIGKITTAIYRQITNPTILKTLMVFMSSPAAARILGFVSGFFVGQIRKQYLWIINIIKKFIGPDGKIKLGSTEIGSDGIKFAGKELTMDMVSENIKNVGDTLIAAAQNASKSMVGWAKSLDFRKISGNAKQVGRNIFQLIDEGLQSFSMEGIMARGGEYMVGAIAGFGLKHPIKAFKLLKSGIKLLANPYVLTAVLLTIAGVLIYNIFKDAKERNTKANRIKRGWNTKQDWNKLPQELGKMMTPKRYMSPLTKQWAEQNKETISGIGKNPTAAKLRGMIDTNLNQQKNFEDMREFLKSESERLIEERKDLLHNANDPQTWGTMTYQAPCLIGGKASNIWKIPSQATRQMGKNPDKEIDIRVKYLMFRSQKFNQLLNGLKDGNYFNLNGRDKIIEKYNEELRNGLVFDSNNLIVNDCQVNALQLYNVKEGDNKAVKDETNTGWNTWYGTGNWDSKEGRRKIRHSREGILYKSGEIYLNPEKLSKPQSNTIWNIAPLAGIYIGSKINGTAKSVDFTRVMFDIAKSSRFISEQILPRMDESMRAKAANNSGNVEKILEIVLKDSKIESSLREMAHSVIISTNKLRHNDGIYVIRVQEQGKEDFYFVEKPQEEVAFYPMYNSIRFDMVDGNIPQNLRKLETDSNYGGKMASGPSFHAYAYPLQHYNSHKRFFIQEKNTDVNPGFNEFIVQMGNLLGEYIIFAMTDMVENQDKLQSVDANVGQIQLGAQAIANSVERASKDLMFKIQDASSHTAQSASNDEEKEKLLMEDLQNNVSQLQSTAQDTAQVMKDLGENYFGDMIEKAKQLKRKHIQLNFAFDKSDDMNQAIHQSRIFNNATDDGQRVPVEQPMYSSPKYRNHPNNL